MDFRKELETLINRHSQENGSNTPDFILADFLVNCLFAFDTAANARSRWYGAKPGIRPPLLPSGTSFPVPSSADFSAPSRS